MPETNVGNPIEACAKPKPPVTPKKPQEPQKHFVNFTITDDKGAAIIGVTLHVVFADDTSSEVTSDKDGKISIQNIPPGEVKLLSDWRQQKVGEIVLIQ